MPLIMTGRNGPMKKCRDLSAKARRDSDANTEEISAEEGAL